MRIKTVYIISAKFAPGHFSHMLAYYQLFKQSGFLSNPDMIHIYL